MHCNATTCIVVVINAQRSSGKPPPVLANHVGSVQVSVQPALTMTNLLPYRRVKPTEFEVRICLLEASDCKRRVRPTHGTGEDQAWLWRELRPGVPALVPSPVVPLQSGLALARLLAAAGPLSPCSCCSIDQ